MPLLALPLVGRDGPQVRGGVFFKMLVVIRSKDLVSQKPLPAASQPPSPQGGGQEAAPLEPNYDPTILHLKTRPDQNDRAGLKDT